MNNEYLTLKFGRLKAWSFKEDNIKANELLTEYETPFNNPSLILQTITDRQKEIICELIDIVSAEEIYLDWDEEYVSKQQAKEYVKNYLEK